MFVCRAIIREKARKGPPNLLEWPFLVLASGIKVRGLLCFHYIKFIKQIQILTKGSEVVGLGFTLATLQGFTHLEELLPISLVALNCFKLVQPLRRPLVLDLDPTKTTY